MRKIQFVPGEYYHVYSRGNDKCTIFRSHYDYARFLFLILYFQSPFSVYNVGNAAAYFIKHQVFNIRGSRKEQLFKNRLVSLVNFTQMPNHFHLTLLERVKNGISSYMQRVLNAYAKYFNTRYERSGHLFEAPFQAVHIEDNEQLLYLSAYVHRNQREIKKWKNREHLYPWSSYQDYIRENRWGELIEPGIVLKQFSSKSEYKDFVETSGAKDKLPDDVFIDYQTPGV
ncbi:MAG: hypothetical protein A3C80_00145 [Candidatus Ryanbacteria bacterium RIFCSPHIGHO2_02_FULL_45_43]|uniref:Transposase IS200-like domain-containing protein n=1 Tax=Candidatus Ryanbacteria bacterium RIFCSPHIGHO2_01_45_13 TaxID=1802112 RepID=A0A1G2G178_9BACT|nr:MAG: hypothetical protein A2718_01530 [Candidatus Ryanbacteria bacterium RIFCSPHIGHO2_01_FULL_44_130]OGZ43752.1 MAG: hypothetical protein A2W41_04650 [Candidatus Ryanbacteria bacterium RIFCSPHIGHO2_01_45_13]OGZ47694.1 MAG: hypothetical protein A3C80_00145 [Candidatus Ryanbacteria bacterium RIFCSPHIGHO2_02_FULL_45_43]OGZ49590.1 MAG: hypothetical protein A3E55_04145 [Candidatus Ryanbacteria bacterium RIFCSPHIGHO2_12_FULL_44_20]OGZ51272.1 MAG: hypothetical protein A3A17_04470 [Candidatus Ryanba